MITPLQLAALYRQACEIELQAFKPGNVSVYADGHDMSVEDFRLSAQVSASAMSDPNLTLGESIYKAVKATQEAVGCNTNLGIILLCAPLLRAASITNYQLSLRDALGQILNRTTVDDAAWVFKAISLAAPGGLGQSSQQDVAGAATVTLFAAMQLASERDRIAKQYVTVYKDIFEFAVLRYNAWLSQWRDENWAAVFLYADLLNQFPDSHIERKYGTKHTEFVARKMRHFLEEFGQTTDLDHIKQHLFDLDAEFKSIGVNPGTTADMTVATVLSVLIEEEHNR
jgi:triphosphoribosyl-dephospho-CoA synthase